MQASFGRGLAEALQKGPCCFSARECSKSAGENLVVVILVTEPVRFADTIHLIWDLGLLNQGENRMAKNQSGARPRLWISYPWIRNEERDFNYLVPQLKAANIEAVYDSFQLQPDSQLGERIIQRLLSIGFDGWLYILTHQ